MEELSDIEFMKKLFLRCQDCKQEKDDVHDTFCPYESEIYDNSVPITVCQDCYDERSYEV